MSRNVFFAAIVVLICVIGSNSVAADAPFKVGFVYVGSVGKHGWTYQHNEGRLAVEEAFGDKVQTTYVELVSFGGQEAERVIRQLAADGHKLIFTTFSYMNPTIEVAKSFPNINFEICSGYESSDNVATYLARFYEGRYVIGRIAGAVTQSNTIGYIAPFPIPEVIRGINSFTLGLRSVNPNATVAVVWVSKWHDPGLEGDAANAMIDQGADVIVQHTDSSAPLQVSEGRGVWAFGQASDMVEYGPKAHLTAIVNNWAPYYIERTRAAMNGTWASGDVWGGIGADMIRLAEFNPNSLPAEVIADAQATVEGIHSGSIHPFAGPIMDQTGNEVIGSDAVLTDADLLGMDYFVMGVEGSLPK